MADTQTDAGKLYRLESAGHRQGHIARRVQVLPDGDMARAMDLSEVETGKGRGFGWGYAGTGAAILAASLIADVFDEQPTREQFGDGACRAFLHMQAVKVRFLVGLNVAQDVHVLPAEEIRAFCLEHEEPCEYCDGEGSELLGKERITCMSCRGLKIQRRRSPGRFD